MESGACVPLKKVASLFVSRRLPKPPRQSAVHDDTRVIRPSEVNTFGTDDPVATNGPHRPTVGSRPWTSPARERAVALTAQYFRRRLRHDRPQHRHTSRWPPPDTGLGCGCFGSSLRHDRMASWGERT